MPGRPSPAPIIHTVGHSNHPIARFVALLETAGVETLIDVRSHPGSRFHPQFNKAALANALKASGIGYRWLGETLGGKPKDASLCDESGHPDYARMASTPAFAAGINGIAALAATSSLAIMCAEEDPARCHRTLLVTPALLARGIAVRHLRGDGRIVDHAAHMSPPQRDLFGEG